MPAVPATTAASSPTGGGGGGGLGSAAAAGVATLAAAAQENLSVFSVGRLPMKKAAEAASECWPALKPIVANQPALSKALFSKELPAGKWCNWTFDTVLCWPPAPANSMLATQCPEIPGLDPSKSAFKTCGPNGLWLGRNNVENEPANVGYTDYMECFPKDTKELINEYDTFRRIALATKKMEAFGFTLSSLSLLVAIFIFFTFRQLRCTRTTIHQHLLSASLLYSILRLVKTVDMLLDEAKGQSQPAGALRGSLNESPTLCKGHIVVYEYSRTVMFMWCFIEGFYMHNIVARRVFNSTSPNFGIYALIGWGFPMVPLAIWTCVMKFVWERVHDSTGKECWYNYSNPKEGYYYIVEGMRQTFIIINVVFLANILRILVHKMRVSNSCYSDVEQVKAMVRATLVLFPLLGVTNLLFLMPAPLTSGTFVFAFWSFSTHFLGSFLGFFVSLIYCFLNKEVKECIKQKLDRRRLQRETGRAAQNRRQSHVDARYSMATIAAAANANSSNNTRASASFMQRLSLVPFGGGGNNKSGSSSAAAAARASTVGAADANKHARRSSSSASAVASAGGGGGLIRAGSQRLGRLFGTTTAQSTSGGDTNNYNSMTASTNVANGSVTFEFPGRKSVGRLSQVREQESRSDGQQHSGSPAAAAQRRNNLSDGSSVALLTHNENIITPLLERRAATSGNDPADSSAFNNTNKLADERKDESEVATPASLDRPHPLASTSSLPPRPLGASASEPHILVYNVEVELNNHSRNPAAVHSAKPLTMQQLLPTTSTSSPSAWLTAPQQQPKQRSDGATPTAQSDAVGAVDSLDTPRTVEDDDDDAASSTKRQSSSASTTTNGRGSEPMLCFSFLRRKQQRGGGKKSSVPGHATAPLLRRADKSARRARAEQQHSLGESDHYAAGANDDDDVETGVLVPLSKSLPLSGATAKSDFVQKTGNGEIPNHNNIVAAVQVPTAAAAVDAAAVVAVVVEDELLTAPSRPG